MHARSLRFVLFPTGTLLIPGALFGCQVAQTQSAPWLTAMTTETHDPYFPIGIGAHAGTDCNVCHGGFDTFKEFDCLNGCHARPDTEPNHAGVTGFAYESASCYSCHPRGTVDGAVNHDEFFPIGADSNHDGVACATCHIDPQDRRNFSCLGGTCHPQAQTDPNHAGVSGYAYASPSCYSCHPKGTAEGAANHDDFFPMGAGSHHAGVACASCHVDPQDYKTFSCVDGGCHPQAQTDPNHSGVVGYVFVSASCYSCHPNGSADGAVNHAAFFPITPSDAHGNVPCATCHADATDHANVTCASATCHASAATGTQHGAVGGYVWSSPSCLRCHADAQVAHVSAHLPFGITSGFKHYKTSCLGCHDAMRTDKPWGADFTPFKCFQTCHNPTEMADTHHDFPSYRPDPPTCVSSGCHRDGRKP
jgi:hypothetical protein